MTTQTTPTNDQATAPTKPRKKYTRRPYDPKQGLRTCLTQFLNHPTSEDHLRNLISGIVGYELNARLRSGIYPDSAEE